MRRGYLVIALCLSALVLSAQANAEIRAVTTRDGEYKATRVLLDGRSGRVWGPVSVGVFGRSNERRGPLLNQLGDRNGDLFPTIQENNLAPHHPWVVWSRFNNAGYDLAWSRWTENGWQHTAWVDPAGEALGDSLDARLAFDEGGRPYVVWWRDEVQGGRVYVSLFLSSSWMRGYPVSQYGVDSRHPTIQVPESGTMIVRYETPNGMVEQDVLFDGPVTITDDINPLDYMQTGSASPVSD